MINIKNIEWKIIILVFKVLIYDEVFVVVVFIEGYIGVCYQCLVGDCFNNYGLMVFSGFYEYKVLEFVINEQDGVLEWFVVVKWGDDLFKVLYKIFDEVVKDLFGKLNYQQQVDMVIVVFCELDLLMCLYKCLMVVYCDVGCGMESVVIFKIIFVLGLSYKMSSVWYQGVFGIGGVSMYWNVKVVVFVM